MKFLQPYVVLSCIYLAIVPLSNNKLFMTGQVAQIFKDKQLHGNKRSFLFYQRVILNFDYRKWLRIRRSKI
jgi:hypothetical protein